MRNKTFRGLLLFFILMGMVACGEQNSPGYSPTSSGYIVITNGTVVDGRGSEPIPDGIVAITLNRITFVGKAADYTPYSGAQIIDAQGGTILPGIIDAHVHSGSDPSIRREYLISGVTAVCDLGSPLEVMPLFEEDHLNEVPVARGFRSGPIITAPGGLPDAIIQANITFEVGTPDEARRTVADFHNRGVNVIKVYLDGDYGGVTYPMLDEAELAAIVEEAHSLGLLVRAHVQDASNLAMAVQAGVDTMEHVPVNINQFGSQSSFEAQVQRLLQSDDAFRVFTTELYPDFENQLRMMAEKGIVMVPTMYIPYGELYKTPNLAREQEVEIEILLEIVRRFHEFGGVVALGTDFDIGKGADPGMPIGEMEMLSIVGLTKMEVIEAGTRISAEICGQGSELGTLETGNLADVIVVAGNPLNDLESMSHVILVISNGEIAVISEGMLSSAE